MCDRFVILCPVVTVVTISPTGASVLAMRAASLFDVDVSDPHRWIASV